MYLSDDTKVLPFSCGLFPKSIQKPEEPKWVIGKTHTISRTREPTRKSDLFPLVAGFPNALGKPLVSRKPLKTPYCKPLREGNSRMGILHHSDEPQKLPEYYLTHAK